MANIRKSFNFKNGVQVDDKDFIVKGSLVGIGTSVPTEILDVRGTSKFVGLATFTNMYSSGIATFSDLRVGIGITLNASGIITAVEFYGNGGTLYNLPTSQWQDVDVGLGFTSIYAVGNVGVSTRDPRYVFQVGQVNLAQAGVPGKRGVGINSQGDVYSTGIVTAFSFVGLGSFLTQVDAANITLGTLDNTRLPILAQDRFPTNLTIAGVLTASQNFSGTLVGDVVGIASTARGLTGNPDIYVGLLSATSIVANSIVITGDSAAPIPGISTVGGLFNVGSGGTGFSASVNAKVGIGTSNPLYSLSISRDTNAAIELTSASGSPRISIGSSVGQGNMAGYLRWDPYVTRGNFDLSNKSTGDLSFTLHGGSSGINTGSYNWIYGQTNNPLMTLTYGGRLGIGITNPFGALHVVGVSSFSSTARFAGGIEVAGTVLYNGTSVLGDPNSFISQNISVQSGVSTFFNVNVGSGGSLGIGTDSPIVGFDAKNSIGLLNSIGLNTTSVPGNVRLYSGGNIILPPNNGTIGIGTTQVFSDSLNGSGLLQVIDGNIRVINGNVLVSSNGKVGINTLIPISAFDMRYANTSSLYRGYFAPPNLTTAERNALNPIIFASAFIYNSSTNQFQGFNGTTWSNFATAGSANELEAPFLNITGIGTIRSLVAPAAISNGITVTGVVTATTYYGNLVGPVTNNGVNVSGIVTATTYYGNLVGPVTNNGVNVSGIVTATTFRGNLTGPVTNNGVNVAGIVTATTFNGNLTGPVTNNGVNVSGIVTATTFNGNLTGPVTNNGVNVSGIVTATTGFISGIGTAVQVTTVGNRVVFTVPGVGTTSIQLF